MHADARRRALAVAVLLLFPAAASSAQTCPEAALLTRGLAEPLATVRYLADDALQGRRAGSDGERCAADYIAARLRALGLSPAGENGSWFQDVPLSGGRGHAAPDAGTAVVGRNVVALLEGADPAARHELIVIGAHYDHLGTGGQGSLAPGETAVHNGADDNASGVAALIRAAALLGAGGRPARSILLVAFTGEESGLLGSAHFTRTPTVELEGARAMLNLDMVGRLESDPLIVYGIGTAAEWSGLVEAHAAKEGIPVALQHDGVGPSDHTSFYLRGIPVLHFFTNTHGDYHRPSDDWQTVDAAGIERVAGLVVSIARAVADAPTGLTLQRGAGQVASAPRSGSGAWLGTVPDFTPVERGVLLGGVTPGSPADEAGMKKGDTLIHLGGHDIADLEGFTAALAARAPGDRVEIVVLRDGREVRLRATLGRRGG